MRSRPWRPKTSGVATIETIAAPIESQITRLSSEPAWVRKRYTGTTAIASGTVKSRRRMADS